jgi:hypothetical protein
VPLTPNVISSLYKKKIPKNFVQACAHTLSYVPPSLNQDGANSAKKEVWFLDSGCSNHMVGTKEWLFDFDDKFRESVKLGDDSKMHVMGNGKLKLLVGGITQVITDVYYFPSLKIIC